MIIKILKNIRSYLIQLKYRGKKVRFLGGNYITSNCNFEGYNSIGFNNYLEKVHLGFGSYLSEDNKLINVRIGKFCSLGSNIRNSRGIHPSNTFVSTHPSFFSLGLVSGFTFAKKQHFLEHKYTETGNYVTIGSDVWIGDNVVIQEGVNIGNGAIVGTNSLVTKDIEPYSINVGIPARRIKYRFDSSDIDLLMKVKWWDRDITWLQENQLLFTDIKKFSVEFSKVDDIN